MNRVNTVLRTIGGFLFQPVIPLIASVMIVIGVGLYFVIDPEDTTKKDIVYPSIEKCEFLDILSEKEQVYKVKCAS